MKFKYIFLIISFTTVLCFSDQIEPKTLSFIYKNKEYFVANCGLSDSISQQSFKEWEEKSAEIISSMIYSFLKSHSKISDSLYLKLLISVIDLPDLRQPKRVGGRTIYHYDTLNWVRDALNYLIHKSALPVLRKYDDLIKAKLVKCEESEEQKLQLLSLLDLSNNEKKELLTRIDILEYPTERDSLKKELEKEKDLLSELSKKRDPDRDPNCKKHYQRMKQIEKELRRIKIQRGKIGKETFLCMRARAGEKKAKEELITIFNKGDFDKKNKVIEPLCMVGTDTCIKTLLEAFDKRILKKERKNRVCSSLRLNMIMNLSRLFPYDEPFFHENIKSLRPFVIATLYENTKEQEKYAEIFKIWAEDKYGMQINYTYEKSGPFKRGACTVVDAIKLLEGEFERAKKQGDFYYERSKKKFGDLLKELKEEQIKK